MNLELVKEMISCISPSGREDQMQKCVYRHYKEVFDEFMVEDQGSLTGIYNKKAPFKIQLAAHADEISLVVNGYNSDGSLQVDTNGGVRTKLYIGTKVQILTENSVLKGIVGTNASFQGKEKVAANELFVDIGCDTKEEAQKLVPKGSYVVHDTDLSVLQNRRLAGRAFDDRIGVYIIFEAAKKAVAMGAKSAIFATSTTGEETTKRGAYASTSRLKPDVCVAVDVTFANDYIGSNAGGDVKVGKGGVICEGSIPNRRLNKLLAECAAQLNLPVQYEVCSGWTHTDADAMLKTAEGVTQTLFSIPLRYMHSPVEVLSMDDVDSMIEILALFLVKLDENYSLAPYTLD